MREMITNAKSKAGSGATPGKVVAELNFGFWPNLVSSRFDKFWLPCLHRAFPFATVPRRVIHGRLDTIRLLRNRIAHHERVLTTGNKLYTGHAAAPYLTLPGILECARWVSPDIAAWLETKFRYAQAKTLLMAASQSGVMLI